jgi:hypothetical protein
MEFDLLLHVVGFTFTSVIYTEIHINSNLDLPIKITKLAAAIADD